MIWNAIMGGLGLKIVGKTTLAYNIAAPGFAMKRAFDTKTTIKTITKTV